MSRDYRAKRLMRELGIPYAEALRRVRAAAAAAGDGGELDSWPTTERELVEDDE